MKTLATLCTLSFLVLGCGDDDRPGDTGISLDRDGASDPRPDTGGGTDSGVRADTGGMMTCSEPLTDLRVINMDPMAMDMLLPRCSTETSTCLSGCETQACANACIAADTTPGVEVGMGTILDCELCNNYQFQVCVSEMCVPSFGDLICCREANGCMGGASCPACMAELSAVQTCAMGLAGACNTHLQACFP